MTHQITIKYINHDEETDELQDIIVTRNVEDKVTSVLNVFSEVLRSIGYTYDYVGVKAMRSEGNNVEHWSEC